MCWLYTTYCSLFGRKGTPYDFSVVDINQLKERARELEDSQKGMKKKVNPKVINMIDRFVFDLFVWFMLKFIDSVEKKEASLTKMLSQVLGDKEKIEETIEELDRYKRDALQKTWEKVNGWACRHITRRRCGTNRLHVQRFRWYFRRAFARKLCQAPAAWWARLNARTRSQSSTGERMETELDRVIRWSTVSIHTSKRG